jgi:hypothetical protein
VNRTVDQPLEVTIYGSTPIPFPLDEIVTADDVEPGPVERQLAAGGIAFTGGAAAFRAYPGLWPTQRAATVAIQREHKCTNSNKNFLLENVHHCPELVPVSFQKAGERQRPQSAIIDTRRHPDPRAAIEAVLGPLAKFEMKPRLVAPAQREQAAAPTDAPLTEEAEMENRSIEALLDTMAAEA